MKYAICKILNNDKREDEDLKYRSLGVLYPNQHEAIKAMEALIEVDREKERNINYVVMPEDKL